MNPALQWFKTLAPTCREATRLQSESLDRRLPLNARLGLRIHLLLCKWCRRYARQVVFLREAFHRANTRPAGIPRFTLSPQDRERMKARLRQKL